MDAFIEACDQLYSSTHAAVRREAVNVILKYLGCESLPGDLDGTADECLLNGLAVLLESSVDVISGLLNLAVDCPAQYGRIFALGAIGHLVDTHWYRLREDLKLEVFAKLDELWEHSVRATVPGWGPAVSRLLDSTLCRIAVTGWDENVEFQRIVNRINTALLAPVTYWDDNNSLGVSLAAANLFEQLTAEIQQPSGFSEREGTPLRTLLFKERCVLPVFQTCVELIELVYDALDACRSAESSPSLNKLAQMVRGVFKLCELILQFDIVVDNSQHGAEKTDESVIFISLAWTIFARPTVSSAEIFFQMAQKLEQLCWEDAVQTLPESEGEDLRLLLIESIICSLRCAGIVARSRYLGWSPANEADRAQDLLSGLLLTISVFLSSSRGKRIEGASNDDYVSILHALADCCFASTVGCNPEMLLASPDFIPFICVFGCLFSAVNDDVRATSDMLVPLHSLLSLLQTFARFQLLEARAVGKARAVLTYVATAACLLALDTLVCLGNMDCDGFPLTHVPRCLDAFEHPETLNEVISAMAACSAGNVTTVVQAVSARLSSETTLLKHFLIEPGKVEVGSDYPKLLRNCLVTLGLLIRLALSLRQVTAVRHNATIDQEICGELLSKVREIIDTKLFMSYEGQQENWEERCVHVGGATINPLFAPSGQSQPQVPSRTVSRLRQLDVGSWMNLGVNEDLEAVRARPRRQSDLGKYMQSSCEPLFARIVGDEPTCEVSDVDFESPLVKLGFQLLLHMRQINSYLLTSTKQLATPQQSSSPVSTQSAEDGEDDDDIISVGLRLLNNVSLSDSDIVTKPKLSISIPLVSPPSRVAKSFCNLSGFNYNRTAVYEQMLMLFKSWIPERVYLEGAMLHFAHYFLNMFLDGIAKMEKPEDPCSIAQSPPASQLTPAKAVTVSSPTRSIFTTIEMPSLAIAAAPADPRSGGMMAIQLEQNCQDSLDEARVEYLVVDTILSRLISHYGALGPSELLDVVVAKVLDNFLLQAEEPSPITLQRSLDWLNALMSGAFVSTAAAPVPYDSGNAFSDPGFGHQATFSNTVRRSILTEHALQTKAVRSLFNNPQRFSSYTSHLQAHKLRISWCKFLTSVFLIHGSKMASPASTLLGSGTSRCRAAQSMSAHAKKSSSFPFRGSLLTPRVRDPGVFVMLEDGQRSLFEQYMEPLLAAVADIRDALHLPTVKEKAKIFDARLDSLPPVASAVLSSCESGVVGILCDLRGCYQSAEVSEHYRLIHEWMLQHDMIFFLQGVRKLYCCNQLVIRLLFKLAWDLLDNRNLRLIFPPGNAAIYILHSNLCRMVTAQCTDIALHDLISWGANIYFVLFRVAAQLLSTNHVNRGVLHAFGDACHSELRESSLQLFVSIPEPMLRVPKCLQAAVAYADAYLCDQVAVVGNGRICSQKQDVDAAAFISIVRTSLRAVIVPSFHEGFPEARFISEDYARLFDGEALRAPNAVACLRIIQLPSQNFCAFVGRIVVGMQRSSAVTVCTKVLESLLSLDYDCNTYSRLIEAVTAMEPLYENMVMRHIALRSIHRLPCGARFATEDIHSIATSMKMHVITMCNVEGQLFKHRTEAYAPLLHGPFGEHFVHSILFTSIRIYLQSSQHDALFSLASCLLLTMLMRPEVYDASADALYCTAGAAGPALRASFGRLRDAATAIELPTSFIGKSAFASAYREELPVLSCILR